MGWVLMIISILLILGVGVIAVWDGFRSDFSFSQFFLRFVWIFTIYKAYDMVFFDWFLLCRFRFFQYYCPEVAPVYNAAVSEGARACEYRLRFDEKKN